MFVFKKQNTRGIIPSGVHSHCSAVVGNSMYIIGGERDSHGLYIYDMDANEWSYANCTGVSPVAKYQMSCAVVDRTIYIFGGFDDDEKCYSDIHSLNVDTLTWKQLKVKGSIPAPRCASSLCAYRRKLYIYGGFDKVTKVYYNDVYSFDIDSNTWELLQTTGDGPQEGKCAHTTTIIEDRMYVFGGYNQNVIKHSFHSLDLYTLEWMKEGRKEISSRFAHVAFAIDNSLYIAFGVSAHGCKSSIREYNTETKTWKSVKVSGSVPKCYANSVEYNSLQNSFLFFGGKNESKKSMNDLYVLEFCEKKNRGDEDKENIPIFKKRRLSMIGTVIEGFSKKRRKNSVFSLREKLLN